MLKGDLTSTPLAPLLLSLANEESTGCLHISDAEGDEALIYFRTGLVYAVSVPGRRPQLGAKLVSSGALAPEALADALEAQRTELQGWKLGELLVHLGYVDQPVVEAFVKEQVNDAVWDLIRWTEGRWRFRKGEKTREDVAPPLTVTELLTTLRERGVEWEAISEVVHGPTAVPVLSAGGGGAAETILDADAWSMLCKIDGERSVAELARDCGYTLFEAGQVLVSLVQAGLVDIEEDVEVSAGSAPMPAPTAVSGDDEDSLYGATSVGSALAAAALADAAADALADAAADEAAIAAVAAAVAGVSGEAAEGAADGADDDFAALARLVSEVAAGVREDEEAQSDAAVAATRVDWDRGDPAAGSVPLRPDSQAFATSVERVSAALAEVLGPAPVTDDPFEVPAEMRVKRTRKKEPQAPPPLDPRAARVRAAAAQELAAAHALAEALREAAAEEPPAPTLRRKRAGAGEAARVEAERVAAEAEAARLAAEEAARVEAESLSAAAAEEAARLAAEEEAARAEAERQAAEEAVRVEAERVAAEEEARLAAEEAARLEAERIAAEETARAEAERIAAEEEAARLAAEEAAHAEAERIAAEEEAARLAAEEEAARVAAEEEAARLAAEQAAARIAAEEEAVRVAAEEEAARAEAERFAAEEAARVLAEEEAAREAAERLAAEKSLAEDQAWTEYWSREADRIAAEEAAVLEAASRESERAAVEQARELAEAAAIRAAAEAEARAREEDEAEATRQRNKSAASAALAELAHDFDATSAEDAAGEPADDEIDDEPVGVPVTVGAPSMEMADTAALLRELSSLGLEDDPTPPPAPRAPSRPTPPAADPKKKKKRGLFGL